MQWEKEIHEIFCGVLPRNPIMDGEEDSMVWNFDNPSTFSVKSFTMQVYKVLYGNLQVAFIINSIWIGSVPPRVEIQVWFVL